MLWGFVALGLLFWGRGAYCGWLCPFGALQELTNRLACLARIPQWRLPFGLHERLWPIKYVIFLALFALFLQDPAEAVRGAEVEPFKTAIILKFDRAWPYVLFALAMLAPGLFIERFYCRYVCPLGALLGGGSKEEFQRGIGKHHRTHIPTIGHQPGGLAKITLAREQGLPGVQFALPEAVERLVSWAFSHQNVVEVAAETLPHLRQSIRVMEKNGFAFRGPGSEYGVVKYVVEKSRSRQ